MCVSSLRLVFFFCDLPAKLGQDSWGEVGCVAASRVLLLTPVLLLVVHWLKDTNVEGSDYPGDATALSLLCFSASALTCRASSVPSTLEKISQIFLSLDKETTKYQIKAFLLLPSVYLSAL